MLHAANKLQFALDKFCKPVRDNWLPIYFMICNIMGCLKYSIYRHTFPDTFSNPIRYFSEESIVITWLIKEKFAVSELSSPPDPYDVFLVPQLQRTH